MQKIKLVCVGKLKEKFWVSALEEYQKRLSRFCRWETIEIPEKRISEHPSPAQIQEVLKGEGETILKKLEGEQQIVALCVEGTQMSSERFSHLLGQAALQGDSLCFVIGGSHGLWEPVKQKAFLRLSFSQMTLPHQLMRVVLAEQIYRGYKIMHHESYHK
ncbi:MAG: 23S rRNA (pseudouridine(1915)-N(3))-methyltransferase RlmH [Clostridia bacterium]|nr:23S rRNA (pseudouridine(1915)-N(3))-methyltransferase RlmH [Clostridia bacterium]